MVVRGVVKEVYRFRVWILVLLRLIDEVGSKGCRPRRRMISACLSGRRKDWMIHQSKRYPLELPA